MAQAGEILQQISNPKLSRNERALLRCKLAYELESGGNYEAARGAMGELWSRVGERPRVDHLEPRARAATLLRVGTLSGHLGSMQQLPQAQELAKDLISEALGIYASLEESSCVAEAQMEMAWCYWREGAFDEARVLLAEASRRLSNAEGELPAMALLRLAIVEKEATQYVAALAILHDAAPLIAALDGHHALKGTYHNSLAMVLRNLGETEKRGDYIDRALIEYTAASYHFEQAGHTRYRAAVENNLGYLYLKADKLDKAREHLDRSRRLFESVKDAGRIAVVDESRARLLLAEGRNFKAERLIRVAVSMLERGGEQARLVEALTTHAAALARLGQRERARRTLARATEIGERIGDQEGAGRATLTLIEELGETMSAGELREAYDRADALLRASQQTETTERLRGCARRIIQTAQGLTPKLSAPLACAFVHAAAVTTEMLLHLEQAARTDVTLLLTGETGTGKEILALQVHAWSARKGPLVPVNCAALNENLLESEVFGHRKGAFTDAIQDYGGAVKRAAGGTLFLDEVGELSAANQAKMLRLLENKEIRAVGSDTTEQVDVRIVAATNRDLWKLVHEGRFRLDLFHRLCVFEVAVPPLRSRREDIRPLAEHFIASAVKRNNRQVTFAEESLAALTRLELPGNARELRSLIERTVILSKDGDVITPRTVQTLAIRRTSAAISPGELNNSWRGYSLAEELKAYEKALLRRALEECDGSITEAARLLGISHQSLIKKLNTTHQDLRELRKEPRRRSLLGKERD